jgi:hypothetical protein
MQLLAPRSRPPQVILKSFRTSPWTIALVLLAVLAGSLFGILLIGRELLFTRDPIRFLTLPILAVGGLVLLLMLALFFHAWRASLRPTNWLMEVARDGVFLNLRSYLNAEFAGEDPTTVGLSFSEIESAGKVEERWTQRGARESSLQTRAYLELVLAGVDTKPLEEAIRVESAKAAPEHSFLGIKIRSRAVDVPVFVAAPGVVRVQWKPGMLSALEEHVRVVERRRIDLTPVFASKGTVDHCIELLRRGEKIGAIQVARRELDLETVDARRRVEEIERRAS